jgi:hypothetical protein
MWDKMEDLKRLRSENEMLFQMWRITFSLMNSKMEDLKRLRFENGDVIPDVESYFI